MNFTKFELMEDVDKLIDNIHETLMSHYGPDTLSESEYQTVLRELVDHAVNYSLSMTRLMGDKVIKYLGSSQEEHKQ